MPSFASLWRRVSGALIPARAPTQTWMVITFGAFVGVAVLAVALYVLLVLRGEVKLALDETLVEQTQRIAVLVNQAETPRERQQIIRDFARITNVRITIAEADSVVWDALGTRLTVGQPLTSVPKLNPVEDGDVDFADHINSDGETVHYVTTRMPGSPLTIRIGQTAPPLLDLVLRMRTTLIVGMMMALFLSLLGSWIAAQRVTLPLQAIRDSARNISEGDLEEQIHVESRSIEMQELAESLNRMSSRFREKIVELERLTQLQTTFIGNVSHEVRNPIFAVGGYLEALSMPGMSDEQREQYARKALTNLERLTNLFNDLIEIARLEYREDIIHPEVFNFTGLVNEVAEILTPKAAEKGLRLDVRNEIYFVEADRNRIRQVILNLIENAIAYSDSGLVSCKLGAVGKKIHCTVTDSGRGMGKEHLERIFERFYRVDPNRSRKSGGTGLGLSIVKQILHAHGEQIHVDSEPGKGTRFGFDLPYAEAHAEVAA